MRKRWKIFWVGCAVLAGLGLVLCLTAKALGVSMDGIRESFPNGIGYLAEDVEYKERTYRGDADTREEIDRIYSIDAEISKMELQILKSDTGKVRLETKGIDPRLHFEYYVEDGELTITTDKHWPLRVKNGGTVYLFLPEDYKLEEADISVGAGYLYIEDILAESLDIAVGAGEADIDHFLSDYASMDCGIGRINAAGSAVADVSLNCGIGEISLNLIGAKEDDYYYSVKCGIGSVRIGEREYSIIHASGDEDAGMDREMDVACGIGDVEVDFDSSQIN